MRPLRSRSVLFALGSLCALACGASEEGPAPLRSPDATPAPSGSADPSTPAPLERDRTDGADGGVDGSAEATRDLTLVLHYDFEGDDATKAVDRSGNGNDGVVSGATRVPGRLGGRALAFDGVNDYVSCGALAAMGAAWTVTFWFETTTFEEGRSLFEGSWTDGFSEPSVGPYVASSTNAGGLLLFGLSTSSGLLTRSVAFEWHHIALTYFQGTARTYYDGKRTLSLDAQVSPPTFSNIQLGRGTGLGSLAKSAYYRGKLDDVRIYRRALEEFDVNDVYSGKK